jgi:nucleotide-binding universal stress UspA family protein
MEFSAFLAIVLLVNLACVVIASYLAVRWGRDPFSWVIVCAVLGPFGLVALAALRPGAVQRAEPIVTGPPQTGTGTKVLVPVDGSEHSLEAVRCVVRDVGASARVTLLAVLPLERGELPADGESPRHQAMENESQGHLAAAAAILRSAGITFQEETAFGEPAEEIIKTAQDGGFDLIVMGRRGRGGLAKALLGSVSEKVVRDAGRPVTVAG